MLRDTGRLAESEQLGRRVLDVQRRVQEPAHPETLGTMIGLGRTLSAEGRFAEAEKLSREALALERASLGLRHRVTLETEEVLASALLGESRGPEAENSPARSRIRAIRSTASASSITSFTASQCPGVTCSGA